ncbi:MAG: AMP-binding protein [Candidatus Neomarinimicrobiota bacterium]
MTAANTLRADLSLPEYHKNLANVLNENAKLYGDYPVYQEVHNEVFVPLLWKQFKVDVIKIQHALRNKGCKPGDRVAILSPNRKEMLEVELAVMAMGAVTVPIFAGYAPKRAEALVQFCDPHFVVVADQDQYDKLSSPESYETIIHFESLSKVQNNNNNLVSFSDLLSSPENSSTISGTNVASDEICLMMYTSGTMGKPKCVQLTHGNILSQQSAMRTLWQLSHNDRFLSYLPWHHSFGGIFEKYAAITNGAVFSLEHGFGKNIRLLLENWKKIHPTVFFSVPRVYQEIVTLIRQDREIEKLIFQSGLRFIFTAAAPLPKNISDIFEDRNIPVIEGWGLTETSPCCTVTDPFVPRESGVVGKPIPGVAIKIADDGEILVHGPNVMRGYFKNSEATKKTLSEDGWFATGDVGEITETGLRLISRKDRIFKLSNAKKVAPSKIENLILKDCTYLAQAYVAGRDRDYPVALLFPNKNMFSQVVDESHRKKDCECPKNINELVNCLEKCLRISNNSMDLKYYRLKSAMLIDHSLSIEKEELTPSMKLAPNVIENAYEANIDYLYGDHETLPEKVYVLKLD